MSLLGDYLERIIALLLGIAGGGPLDDLSAQIGSGATFTCTAPYAPGTLRVYKNGLLMNPGAGNDYTESDPAAGEFTFEAGSIPVAPGVVLVTYIAA